MPLLPTLQSDDQTFQLLQTRWAAILNPVLADVYGHDHDGEGLVGAKINANNLIWDSTAADTVAGLITSTGTASIASVMQANSQWVLPPGMVAPYAGSVAPTGWLLCDGTAVSRSTYATLFAAIGTTYGSGDGSTTFNVPDTRGVFISGVGSQTISGITYTRTLGAKQGDTFQGHYHSANAITGSVEWTDASGSLGVWNNATGALSAQSPAYARPVRGSTTGSLNAVLTLNVTPTITAATTDGTNGTPRKGSETRPANIAMNYIIKT